MNRVIEGGALGSENEPWQAPKLDKLVGCFVMTVRVCLIMEHDDMRTKTERRL